LKVANISSGKTKSRNQFGDIQHEVGALGANFGKIVGAQSANIKDARKLIVGGPSANFDNCWRPGCQLF